MSSSRIVGETISVRMPKALWRKIQARALAREESGQAWLGRCAEVCLGVAETGVARQGIRPEAVEPSGSVAGKTEGAGQRDDLLLETFAGTIQDLTGTDVRRGVVRCPKCGCQPSQHRTGSKRTRCEVHPACVWEDVPGEDQP